MLTLLPHSAKELDHYNRVRQTFEGPSQRSKTKSEAIDAPSKILAPAIDGHLHPPVLATHPKPNKSRSSTDTKQSEPKGKGKGKATQWNSDDDDDDDAYVTSNDFAGTPERNGSGRGVNGFGDVGGNDDQEIYS